MNRGPKQKNSFLALHKIKSDPKYELVGLITTINQKTNTIPKHGIPDVLLMEQAKLLQLPVQRIFLPENYSWENYSDRVSEVLLLFIKKNITHFAFGDTKENSEVEFRHQMFEKIKAKILYPLWDQNSNDLIQEFIHLGCKALVTSIDQNKLDKTFLNCEFNSEFFERLPPQIDKGGANSEYHTFVIFAPGFRSRLAFSKALAIEEGEHLVSIMKEP